MILKNCRYLVTQNDKREILENIDVKIDKGKIVEIGHNIPNETSEKTLDCSKCIVIPGLIDAHTHLFTAAFRGMYLNKNWNDFWHKLSLKRLNDKKLKDTWLKTISTFLASGTTAISASEPKYELLENMGPPLKIIGGPYLFKEEGMVLGKIVHLDSLYTISLDFLKETIKFSKENNVLISIHASNTRDEVFSFKNSYGKFPIEYIESINALNENVILVGLEWITSWEIESLSRCKAKVVLTPTCSMVHALGGLPPVMEFLKKNIKVGIGTCSLTCSSHFMLHEAKILLMYIRNGYWDLNFTTQTVFDLVTLNNAEILGLNSGAIIEDKDADITIINAESSNLYPLSRKNIITNLVLHSEPHDVMYTIVNGNIVYSRKINV